MVAYAEVEDVYRQGLVRGTGQQLRDVASVDVAGNRFELGAHGFGLNTPVQFVARGQAVLPAPLSAAAVYHAIPVSGSDAFFQVAETENGAALDITTAGDGYFGVVVPVTHMLEQLLETFSRWFDGKAIGHQVPFTAPYPAVATHAVAIRTAAHAARILGKGSASERLFEAEELLLRDIDALARGIPLRDATASPPANLAVYAVYGSAAVTRRRKLP